MSNFSLKKRDQVDDCTICYDSLKYRRFFTLLAEFCSSLRTKFSLCRRLTCPAISMKDQQNITRKAKKRKRRVKRVFRLAADWKESVEICTSKYIVRESRSIVKGQCDNAAIPRCQKDWKKVGAKKGKRIRRREFQLSYRSSTLKRAINSRQSG